MGKVRRAISVVAAAALLATAAGLERRAVRAQSVAALASGADAASRGRTVYDAHCAYCHGPDGKGDGPAAAQLTPVPRDFTSAKYKLRSTDTGQLPTDDDLRQSVRDGLNGTAMPPWEGVLSDADIAAVVGYIETFSPRFATEHPQPVKVAVDPGRSPDSVARGQKVYEKLQCRSCHGTDGRGTNAVARRFKDDWGHDLPVTDLTEPWTFRGGARTRDIFLRFRTGMSGTPMPSFAGAATDAEMWDLAAYVASLGRKPIWSMTADEVAAQYAREERDARAHPVTRGEYLVNALSCALCHSPTDDQNRALPGLRLAGGMHVRVEPFGDYYTCNLTSDKETGIGGRTDEELKRTLTTGILHDGTRLPPYPMDWGAFSTMKDEDLDAVIAYLRSLPPVYNKVPRLQPTPFVPYMWGKFKMLILQQDPPIVFYPGNAGAQRGGRS